QATNWARQMVTEYGMSDVLGPVSYAEAGGDVFLGRDLAARKEYSESKAQEIDEEISGILSQKYTEAVEILTTNRDTLVAIAENLLERETLETTDLKMIVDGDPLPAMRTSNSDSSPGSKEPVTSASGDINDGDLPDPEPFPG
ncbi:MAG: cell division protein FtsH, partial [Spirochaeta sp.]